MLFNIEWSGLVCIEHWFLNICVKTVWFFSIAHKTFESRKLSFLVCVDGDVQYWVVRSWMYRTSHSQHLCQNIRQTQYDFSVLCTKLLTRDNGWGSELFSMVWCCSIFEWSGLDCIEHHTLNIFDFSVLRTKILDWNNGWGSELISMVWCCSILRGHVFNVSNMTLSTSVTKHKTHSVIFQYCAQDFWFERKVFNIEWSNIRFATYVSKHKPNTIQFFSIAHKIFDLR